MSGGKFWIFSDVKESMAGIQEEVVWKWASVFGR